MFIKPIALLYGIKEAVTFFAFGIVLTILLIRLSFKLACLKKEASTPDIIHFELSSCIFSIFNLRITLSGFPSHFILHFNLTNQSLSKKLSNTGCILSVAAFKKLLT